MPLSSYDRLKLMTDSLLEVGNNLLYQLVNAKSKSTGSTWRTIVDDDIENLGVLPPEQLNEALHSFLALIARDHRDWQERSGYYYSNNSSDSKRSGEIIIKRWILGLWDKQSSHHTLNENIIHELVNLSVAKKLFSLTEKIITQYPNETMRCIKKNFLWQKLSFNHNVNHSNPSQGSFSDVYFAAVKLLTPSDFEGPGVHFALKHGSSRDITHLLNNNIISPDDITRHLLDKPLFFDQPKMIGQALLNYWKDKNENIGQILSDLNTSNPSVVHVFGAHQEAFIDGTPSTLFQGWSAENCGLYHKIVKGYSVSNDEYFSNTNQVDMDHRLNNGPSEGEVKCLLALMGDYTGNKWRFKKWADENNEQAYEKLINNTVLLATHLSSVIPPTQKQLFITNVTQACYWSRMNDNTKRILMDFVRDESLQVVTSVKDKSTRTQRRLLGACSKMAYRQSVLPIEDALGVTQQDAQAWEEICSTSKWINHSGFVYALIKGTENGTHVVAHDNVKKISSLFNNLEMNLKLATAEANANAIKPQRKKM